MTHFPFDWLDLSGDFLVRNSVSWITALKIHTLTTESHGVNIGVTGGVGGCTEN